MNPSAALGSLLLGKSEIAALARVQRPVVTMWISRYRRRPQPFPAPVITSGGRPLYRGGEVADWITARGLGNNPALREDLALYAALDAAPPGQRAQRFDALTAVLCLKRHLGQCIGDIPADALVATAHDLDPDDAFLRSEIEALGPELATLARYVDLLTDAAYDPAAAFEAVLAKWDREPGSDRREIALSRTGEDFVGTIAAALLPDGDEPAGAVHDPDPHAADLLLATRRALPEYAEPEIGMPRAAAGARLALRRLLIHGVQPAFTAGTDALLVTRLPVHGVAAGLAEVLSAASDRLGSLPPPGRGIILGPAAALCDPILDGEVDLARWELLRGDRVRLIARLPEGLLPARTGVALALWIVGPHRDLAPAQRWMAVADLSGEDLNTATARALADDALACLTDFGQAGRHAFQLARVVRSADVIARRRLLPVPPPSAIPDRPAGGADLAVRAEQTLDRLAAAGSQPLATPAVTMQLRPGGRRTLLAAAQLEQDGEVTVLPGLRIQAEDIDTSGEVTVLGPEEVLGVRPTGARRIDRIAFSTGYPRGRYTEPGDIVFTAAPRFGAMVDAQGSSVVLAPARILRITDPERSGLVPAVVAWHLARTAPGHRPAGAIRAGAGWRSWMLPAVDPATVPDVAAALDELERYRSLLADMLAAADDVTDSVTAGLSAGTVTIQPSAPARRERARSTTEKKER